MWWVGSFMVKGGEGGDSEKEEKSPICGVKHTCKTEEKERLCFSEELTQLHGGGSTSNYTGTERKST